jgi:hypothetical protein
MEPIGGLKYVFHASTHLSPTYIMTPFYFLVHDDHHILVIARVEIEAPKR